MKAAVYYEYGSAEVIQIVDLERPVPGDEQVVIRVRAASLNPADKHMMKGAPLLVRKAMGLTKPTRDDPRGVGLDVAGIVETVGKNVTNLKPGDEVFGACPGACAEFGRSTAWKVVPKPANVTFEEAASSPVAAFTAIQGLRDKGHIKPGQKVLINGAAGGVGTFAVQIAKYFGAEVTGVCSTRNVDMVRSIGADHVIDYTQEDFTKSGEPYDIVFDCIVNRSLSEIKRILKPEGICVLVGGPESKGTLGFVGHLLKSVLRSKFGKQKFLFFMAKTTKEDLALISELMANGKVKPVIDRTYPLAETAEAMRHLAGRHARGKIIVTVE